MSCNRTSQSASAANSHLTARGSASPRSSLGRNMRNLCLAALLFSGACFGQTAQPPATPAELKYLRFLILNVASLDHSPDAIKSYEDSLVLQFGLNPQDSVAIHSAGPNHKYDACPAPAVHQTLVAGKTALRRTISRRSKLQCAARAGHRTLANQILNTVTPVTAARLRPPGISWPPQRAVSSLSHPSLRPHSGATFKILNHRRETWRWRPGSLLAATRSRRRV